MGKVNSFKEKLSLFKDMLRLSPVTPLRIVSILVAIFVVGTFSAESVIPQALSGKPRVNLIPEEIRPVNFAGSFPYHKQFLSTAPINVVINFNKEFERFTSSISYQDTDIANTPMTNQRGNFIRQSVPRTDWGEGLYLVKYTVCFEQNCSQGQFVYQIDGRLGTQLDNQTKSGQTPHVDVEITENSAKPVNFLTNRGAVINFKNVGQTSLSIKSEPQGQNNYYPPLNSPEIKVDKSFSITLETPGPYFFYLESNPQIKGQIYVQNN